MNVIINAGGVPLPEDPLYPYIYGHPEALLEIAGRPMIQWVLDALSAAKGVEQIVLVGLNEKSGLNCRKPISYVPNQGRWFENLRAGAARLKAMDSQAKYALSVPADLPGLRAEMVDWVVEQAQPHKEDAIVTLIPRQRMEKRLPERRFPWAHLLEGEFWIGGLTICRLEFLLDPEQVDWTKLAAERKNPAGLASRLGMNTYLQYLSGRLSLEQAAAHVERRTGLRTRALECPYAEVGMRVDDPEMLDCLEVELKKQIKKAAADGALKGKAAKKPAPAKKAAAASAVKGKASAAISRPGKPAPAKAGKKPARK
jgi:hypothetical protein